jgi:hypothetical protein
MPLFALFEDSQGPLVEPLIRSLRSSGLICLVDPVSNNRGSAERIIVNIVDRLRDANHLLLFIPSVSPMPWWVSFALGAAAGQDRRIVICNYAEAKLEHYMLKWPRLKGEDDFARFVECYRSDSSVPFTESGNTFHTIRASEQFHRKLKDLTRER